jgi:opacity protein-like surface antigen
MAKGSWHFPVQSTRWWPFVSAGGGWSRNTVKSSYTPPGQAAVKSQGVSDSLAWTAGVGATFWLGPQVMNDVELRYVDLGSVDWGMDPARNLSADSFGSLTATELVFSLRYMF